MSSCYSAQRFSTNTTNCTSNTIGLKTITCHHSVELFPLLFLVPLSPFFSFFSGTHTSTHTHSMKSLVLSPTILTVIYRTCTESSSGGGHMFYSGILVPFHSTQNHFPQHIQTKLICASTNHCQKMSDCFFFVSL